MRRRIALFSQRRAGLTPGRQRSHPAWRCSLSSRGGLLALVRTSNEPVQNPWEVRMDVVGQAVAAPGSETDCLTRVFPASD
jgi:hypothetical protein